jgi:hypothetical protein
MLSTKVDFVRDDPPFCELVSEPVGSTIFSSSGSLRNRGFDHLGKRDRMGRGLVLEGQKLAEDIDRQPLRSGQEAPGMPA